MALTKVSSGLMKPDNNLELEYTSQLGTTSVVGAATGYVVRTNYYDANVTAGSGATFKFTGVTTLGKAGNVPNADGYFYDAVGRQFEVVGSPVSVLWFGAVADGATNVGGAVETAMIYLESVGGGTIFFPASDSFYAVITPIVCRSNITLKGEGYNSCIQNITTSGGAWGEEMVVTMGTFSAADFIRETAYTMTLAVEGTNTFTVTGNGGNFSAGDLIYLCSLEESTTNVPLKAEICEVKSVAGDVVTVFRPLVFTYDGTTPKARVSTNTVPWYDGVHNINMIKHAALIDLRLTTNAASTESWLRHGGMYECKFEGLFTSGWYGIGCNGMAYSSVKGCVMEFGTAAIEPARYSVNSEISGNSFYYNPLKSSGNPAALVFFSETCHGIRIHDNIIDTGIRQNGGLGSGDVIFIGSFSNCSFQNNLIYNGVNDATGTGYLIDYQPLDASNSNQTVWKGNIISGNTWDAPDYAALTGLRLLGETGSGRAMVKGHLTVSNNTFYCPSIATSSGTIRFSGTNPNGFIVENNSFSAGNIVPSATGYANIVRNNAFAIRPFIQTQTNGNATPSVLGGGYLRTSVVSGNTISNLKDGYEGQEVTVIVYGATFTMTHGGSGLIYLNGGATFSAGVGSSIRLIYDGTSWFETGRNVQ
jgi:hypothetical protein